MHERPAFQDLAREQLPWLYPLARRLAGSHAEDVVQETLTKAFRKYDSLRDHVAAPAWFRAILVNSARDQMRRESAGLEEAPVEDMADFSHTMAGGDPWPYSDALHLDFLREFYDHHLWEVLDRLRPMYRVPLVLVHMEGMPTRQVARILGVPLNTVLSWLHRGRQAFENELWEYAHENDLLKQRGIG